MKTERANQQFSSRERYRWWPVCQTTYGPEDVESERVSDAACAIFLAATAKQAPEKLLAWIRRRASTPNLTQIHPTPALGLARPGFGWPAILYSPPGVTPGSTTCVFSDRFTNQRVKDAGILRRYAHTAMRNGSPETFHLVAAMDSMAIRHEKDRVRHGSVVPLFAVPNLIHGRGSVSPRRRRIAWPTGRYAPVVFL